MEILKLNAPCKDYIWGGNRLREEYGKVSDADKIAESWELSCHKDGQSVIANGKDKGKTLSEYVAENKNALGTACGRFEYFPILIKLIDAKDNLSVQVHPDNDYAMRVEGEYGKTEMWYIVDCEEGSQLIYGFDKEISREEFADRIKNNTLLEVTNNVPVHPKYDTKPQGKPVKIDGGEETLLRSCEYFDVHKIKVSGTVTLDADEKSFMSVLVLDGSGKIGELDANKGDSFFVPAGYGRFTLTGNLEVILSDIV